MQKSQTGWANLLLFFSVLFGAVVRFAPTVMSGSPINDGGMFYVMIEGLKANHFLLPAFTSYNHLDIPFAYQQEIRQKILDMYGFEAVPEEIEQYIQAASAEPAMEESAIFDAVVDIVVKGDYDYYIYDLVPLGHALYYLSMAKVYDEWINRITKLREEMREHEEMVSRIKREKTTETDQILNELTYIKTRINASSRILTDREKAAFFFVVVPDRKSTRLNS